MAQIDMGNSRTGAWNMGTLAKQQRNRRTGETKDSITGADWNEGIVSNNSTATSTINETIGGDDVTDWARFKVNVAVQVNLVTENAIAAIVNDRRSVVVDSDDGYSSNLTATLQPGIYFLQFSSESSIPALFTSQLTLTKV